LAYMRARRASSASRTSRCAFPTRNKGKADVAVPTVGQPIEKRGLLRRHDATLLAVAMDLCTQTERDSLSHRHGAACDEMTGNFSFFLAFPFQSDGSNLSTCDASAR
jgi:hypothetical protein